MLLSHRWIRLHSRLDFCRSLVSGGGARANSGWWSNLSAQLFQHCWGQKLGPHELHMVSKLKVLWAVSFPRCTVGPDIGRCCIRLHTTADKHATAPNNVVSCCVRFYVNSSSLYKEWEWINGFQKLKKISLSVTTTQRLWNWLQFGTQSDLTVW